jgi:hypothetical protein
MPGKSFQTCIINTLTYWARLKVTEKIVVKVKSVVKSVVNTAP